MSHPILFIISILIALIAILLTIIYALNKKFRSYPCYYNVLFTLIITFDNLIRLIPGGKRTYEEEADDGHSKSIPCHIQALSLTIFDKMMLTLMTSYSIISFFGICKVDFYKSHIKSIFISLTILSSFISLLFSILFYNKGISDRSEFCYVETKNNFKKVLDTIVTSVLWIISLICIVKILLQMTESRKERELEIEKEKIPQGVGSFNKHLTRYIINLILTSITFIYVILLILKKLSFNSFAKDLIYILLSLFNELFFTINDELIKELKRILTCTPQVEENNDNDYNEGFNEEIEGD